MEEGPRMPICPKLKKFLDDEAVNYKTISHPQAFTMQEIAAASHISGRKVAKSVVVKTNGKLSLCVLSATAMLDFSALNVFMGVERVSLASEDDFARTFEECELGAFCPFGHLYDLPTYMDEAMWKCRTMVFNGGTHRDMVEIEVEDYCRLVNPQVGPISRQ
jgi:Ala-tRNA(Pro) deacylase